MYSKTLPDIWQADKGNERSKKIHIHVYINIVYNLF